MTRPLDSEQLATILLGQLGWAAATLTLCLVTWNRGIRRFEAVGG